MLYIIEYNIVTVCRSLYSLFKLNVNLCGVCGQNLHYPPPPSICVM